MTVGPLSGDTAIWQEDGGTIGVFGRPGGANVQIVFDSTTGKGSWTFNGLQGTASGTVTLSE